MVRRWKLNVECSMFLLFVVTGPSLLGQTTNTLPTLSPPLPELPPTLSEKSVAAIREHPAATFIGVIAILLLTAVALWLMFKPRPPKIIPPEMLARQALARLQDRPEDGKVLSEVSQILRHYISTALGFPPGELTTAEFSAVLAGNRKIGEDLARTISKFLRECDERKFSPAVRSAAFTRPDSPEGGTPGLPPPNATNRALDIIQMVGRASSRAEPQSDSSPTSPQRSAK